MNGSISQSINPNYRISPVIEGVENLKGLFKTEHAKVISAALPLLTLFRPLQLAINLQTGLLHSYACICNLSFA